MITLAINKAVKYFHLRVGITASREFNYGAN